MLESLRLVILQMARPVEPWKISLLSSFRFFGCEFLLRNFLLFAHTTMFEQNNLNQIWKFSNKHFLFNFRFALRTRCVFQFSQHFNFMVKHDESLFRLKLFPSRVGWEGFAPFMTEKFSSFKGGA